MNVYNYQKIFYFYNGLKQGKLIISGKSNELIGKHGQYITIKIFKGMEADKANIIVNLIKSKSYRKNENNLISNNSLFCWKFWILNFSCKSYSFPSHIILHNFLLLFIKIESNIFTVVSFLFIL